MTKSRATLLVFTFLQIIGDVTAASDSARRDQDTPLADRSLLEKAGELDQTSLRDEQDRRWLAFGRGNKSGPDLKDESAYSHCPEGYPAFGRLGELLTAWNPNQPDEPEGVVVERLHVSSNCQRNTCWLLLPTRITSPRQQTRTASFYRDLASCGTC